MKYSIYWAKKYSLEKTFEKISLCDKLQALVSLVYQQYWSY